MPFFTCQGVVHLRLPVSVSLIISPFDIEFQWFEKQVEVNSYHKHIFNDLMLFPSQISIKSIKKITIRFIVSNSFET